MRPSRVSVEVLQPRWSEGLLVPARLSPSPLGAGPPPLRLPRHTRGGVSGVVAPRYIPAAACAGMSLSSPRPAAMAAAAGDAAARVGEESHAQGGIGSIKGGLTFLFFHEREKMGARRQESNPRRPGAVRVRLKAA